jgi:hypothetical protein
LGVPEGRPDWGTLDASLSNLIPNANYTKLFKRFFAEAQSRAVKKALQISTITSAVSGVLATAAEYGSMIGPIVRRQALVFQGVSSKIAYLWTVVFRVLKIGVIIAGLFFLYDFLLMYEPQWVSGINEQALDSVARKIPAYDVEVGFGIVVLLIYAYWLLGRLRRRFSQTEVTPSSSGSIAGR